MLGKLDFMLFLEMSTHEISSRIPHLEFKVAIIAFSKFFIINN